MCTMCLNNLSPSSSQLTNNSLFKDPILYPSLIFRKLMLLMKMMFQYETPTQAKSAKYTVPEWQPGQRPDMRKPTSLETKATMKKCLDD